MVLPKLVGQTIISAGNTGRKFSWKVKESEKERLIQLVWKAELEIPTILAATTCLKQKENDAGPMATIISLYHTQQVLLCKLHNLIAM